MPLIIWLYIVRCFCKAKVPNPVPWQVSVGSSWFLEQKPSAQRFLPRINLLIYEPLFCETRLGKVSRNYHRKCLDPQKNDCLCFRKRFRTSDINAKKKKMMEAPALIWTLKRRFPGGWCMPIISTWQRRARKEASARWGEKFTVARVHLQAV